LLRAFAIDALNEFRPFICNEFCILFCCIFEAIFEENAHVNITYSSGTRIAVAAEEILSTNTFREQEFIEADESAKDVINVLIPGGVV
jgi:hypothetical protein